MGFMAAISRTSHHSQPASGLTRLATESPRLDLTDSTMQRISLSLFGLIALFACTAPQSSGPDYAPLAPPKDNAFQRTMDSIARFEDHRDDGGGDLERLASASEVDVRLRAVAALGRMPYPELGGRVTDALVRALGDDQAEIRATAAFGIGLRADPESEVAIMRAMKDKDATVRARAVEAGSRFESRAVREELMYSLSDPSPLVRAEAALAPHRWELTSITGAVVDSAIANLATRAPAELRRERWGLPESGELEPEAEDLDVIWRALFTLSRRKAERGRPVFYLWARAPQSVEARIFANRGIASLSKKTPECMEALRESLGDEDARVAVEAAVGLGRFPEAASLQALATAANHKSTQVRVAVVEALAEFRGHRETVKGLLEKRLVDASPAVRAAATVSMAKLFSDAVAADLQLRSLDGDPRLRRAVARSTAFLSPPVAMELLTRLSDDPVRSVAFEATQALGPFLDHGGRERAHELLSSADNGLRLGAVLALQTAPTAADLGVLLRTYSAARGDIAGEIEYEVMKTAAKVKDDRAFELLVTGLRSRRPYTRQVARELLAEHFPSASRPDDGSIPPRRGDVPSIDMTSGNPLVEIRTARGLMVFELYPRQAPLHVYNFLTLARQGAYNGLDFHRVVPDFVIQGGDYRGDGNGGKSWRGEPLRAEFSARKFLTGSLGMPRNADPNSGGSQFFVTHRPTPHLDGHYTLFGQLQQGAGVLQQIELGDEILEVRVRGAGGSQE